MKPPILPLCAAGLLAVTLTPIRAQDAPPQQGRQPMTVEQRLERMKTSLTLTDDQVAKLKPILEEQKAKLDALMADESVPRDQRREKMRAIMDEYTPKIEAVLTPEQKAKFEELRKQRMQRQGGDQGGAKADQGGAKASGGQ